MYNDTRGRARATAAEIVSAIAIETGVSSPLMGARRRQLGESGAAGARDRPRFASQDVDARQRQTADGPEMVNEQEIIQSRGDEHYRHPHHRRPYGCIAIANDPSEKDREPFDVLPEMQEERDQS